MKHFKKTYQIQAPIAVVWDALTNPKSIDDWGGGPAKMSGKSQTDFSLWGGDIYGKNTNVVEHDLIQQDWYQKGWDKPSHVVFQLTNKNNKTFVDLMHSDIPDSDYGDIKDGWDSYYMHPLIEYVEAL